MNHSTQMGDELRAKSCGLGKEARRGLTPPLSYLQRNMICDRNLHIPPQIHPPKIHPFPKIIHIIDTTTIQKNVFLVLSMTKIISKT